MKYCVFIFLAMFLCMPEAYAARFSGQYLLHVCGSDEAGQELVAGGHVACQGYIAGVLDYHTLVRSLGTAPSVDFCVSADVSMNALQQQVVDYMTRHQKQHNGFIAAPGIALALFEKYPCQ